MKLKIILMTALVVIFGGSALPSFAQTNAPSGATHTAPTPYPLTTCVVSGEKLGEMGPPIELVYTNSGAHQEMKFCCPMCKEKFLAAPNPYLKKIQAAENAAKK